MSDGRPGYQLAMTFTRASEDYALGFEAGRVWADLAGAFAHAGGATALTVTVHRVNLVQFERMAAYHELALAVTDLPRAPEWVVLRFARRTVG